MIGWRRLSGYQRLGAIMLLGLLALVVLGGTVRVTDSGLACPDWPLCHGNIIPQGDFLVEEDGQLVEIRTYQVWIEWTHRLVASVIGFAILAFVIGAVRKFRDRPWIVIPAVLGVGVLGVQIVLGVLTVTQDLDPAVVSSHLGTAMLIILLMLTAWLSTFVPIESPPDVVRVATRERLALGSVPVLGGLLALLVLGAYVGASEAGFFCGTDWPLCNGSLLPEGRLPSIHMAHRYFAAIEGLLVLGLWGLSYRYRDRATLLLRLATLIVALYGVQVLLGAIMLWTTLEDWVRAVHLLVAAMTWMATIVLTAVLLRRGGWLTSVGRRTDKGAWRVGLISVGKGTSR